MAAQPQVYCYIHRQLEPQAGWIAGLDGHLRVSQVRVLYWLFRFGAGRGWHPTELATKSTAGLQHGLPAITGLVEVGALHRDEDEHVNITAAGRRSLAAYPVDLHEELRSRKYVLP